MSTHSNSVTAQWKGSFDGRGYVEAAGFSQIVTLPKDFQGLGEGASPEDLLLSALASCYLITLGIILDKASVKYESLTVTSELHTTVQPSPRIRAVNLRVKVISDEDPTRLRALGEKAEAFCLIARAVHGNIEKDVEFLVERRVPYCPLANSIL